MIYEGGVPAGVILSAGHQTALVSSNVNIFKPGTNFINSLFPAEEGNPGRCAAVFSSLCRNAGWGRIPEAGSPPSFLLLKCGLQGRAFFSW